MIPERTRVWAQRHLPSPIVSIRPMAGGRTDSINAIDLADGSRRTLRFLDADAWGPTGARHVTSEALAWQLGADGPLPVPTYIAVDSTAAAAGGYANLSSWLPGRVRLDALGPPEIDALAGVAANIHRTSVPPEQQPRRFDFWAPPVPEIPGWARDRASWRAALRIFAEGAPTSPYGLVHRDFHAGNILWLDGRITGVIDWAETSWGPAAVDVMHARTNLAILQDTASADAFVANYLRHGGQLDADPADRRFWAVADILGFLPDPVPILNRLIRSRTDLNPTVVRDRLEALLLATLQ